MLKLYVWGKVILHIRKACLLALMLAIMVQDGTALAWKPNTHIFLAEQALQDAMDGKISIYKTNYSAGQRLEEKVGEYAVDSRLLRAIQTKAAHFRAGVIGPDGYPDIATGQQCIHPDHEDGGAPSVYEPSIEGSNNWLKHLWINAQDNTQNSDAVWAFTYGYLSHAAGDMYAHTFVNHYTGGTFNLGDNAIRHLVLEGYIGKRTPNNYNQSVSIAGVENFIYKTLIDARPSSKLAELYRGEGNARSLPWLFSERRAQLQNDIDGYYRQKTDYDKEYTRLRTASSNCALLDTSCSSAALTAQALAVQAKKATYMATNGPGITYKEHWVRDIDDGLKAWPQVSHQLAIALMFNPSGGPDRVKANQVIHDYVYHHLISMAGAPDMVGVTAEAISNIIDAIPLPFAEALRKAKEDLLAYLISSAFGMDPNELMGMLKNPEQYFDRVMATTNGERTTLAQFNNSQLKITDSGYSQPSQSFNYEVVPAAYNTVTMIKLLMLSQEGTNHLLADLHSQVRLDEPTAMLGFIRTLDGSNEWQNHSPYQMVLAKDCRAYRQIFMYQKGQSDGLDRPECQLSVKPDIPPKRPPVTKNGNAPITSGTTRLASQPDYNRTGPTTGPTVRPPALNSPNNISQWTPPTRPPQEIGIGASRYISTQTIQYNPGQQVVVISQFMSDSGQGIVTLVPAYVPTDNQTVALDAGGEWHQAEMKEPNAPVTLIFTAPERPGTYHLRLYNEGPMIEAITIQVGNTGNGSASGQQTFYGNAAPSGYLYDNPAGGVPGGQRYIQPSPSPNVNHPYVGQSFLKLDQNVFRMGDTIYLHYSTDSRADNTDAKVILVPAHAPHGSQQVAQNFSLEWHYTSEAQGILTFATPDRPGQYELRFYLDDVEIQAVNLAVQ